VTRSKSIVPVPPVDPARALVGRTVADRYLVRSIVGRGGMGVVYAADDLAAPGGARVALKVLPRLLRDPTSLRRFEREVRVMQRMRHPAIVAIHELGTLSTQEPWFTMELLTGETLHERIDDGPVPPSELATILAPIAGALDALHAEGMLHRDIKPGNVLYEDPSRTRTKLADFGLALLTDGALPRLTDPGTIVGTPAYIPPEATTTRVWTAASDHYALGVLIFEALTRAVPFDGGTVDVLIAKRRQDAPTLAEKSGRTFDPALEALVARCLARDPALRPGSASEIVAELARTAG
jgi:serine/threonine protein kinase